MADKRLYFRYGHEIDRRSGQTGLDKETRELGHLLKCAMPGLDFLINFVVQ